MDRHYGPALSWAAICHWRLVESGWAEAPEESRRKGVELARQALQAAQNDPGILANAAIVLARFGEDIGAMIGLVDRADVAVERAERDRHDRGECRWSARHRWRDGIHDTTDHQWNF